MNFPTAIKTVFFKKYATFRGRASRSEYWWWMLASSIVLGIVYAINTQMHMKAAYLASYTGFSRDVHQPYLPIITLLVLFLPGLAVTVRRLHDSDRSGWWFLIILIPLLGDLILIFFMLMRGTVGPNRFGPDPLDPLSVSMDWSAPEAPPATSAPQDSITGVWDNPAPTQGTQQPEPQARPKRSEKPTKSEKPARPFWRTPTTRKDGFQTTQERFKDK